ncbi:MAG: HK97 family phage prohead protease [Pseudonocardiaceae bacterium]
MATPATDLSVAPPARLDVPVLRALRPGVELRATDDGPGVMAGHFSVFNRWFEINSWFEGRFLERVAPGSFKRTFDHWRDAHDPHRIQVLLEHGWDPTVGDKPLGMPESLAEDKTGAAYEVPLFDASYVRDLLPALGAGAYGASYRFRVLADSWDHEPEASEHNPDALPERTITEQHVVEFGPTVFPANPHATAGVRSLTDHYYEQLRSTQPRAYDDVVRRVTLLRTPPDTGAGPANPVPHGSPPRTRRTPTHARQALRRYRAKEMTSHDQAGKAARTP